MSYHDAALHTGTTHAAQPASPKPAPMTLAKLQDMPPLADQAVLKFLSEELGLGNDWRVHDGVLMCQCGEAAFKIARHRVDALREMFNRKSPILLLSWPAILDNGLKFLTDADAGLMFAPLDSIQEWMQDAEKIATLRHGYPTIGARITELAKTYRNIDRSKRFRDEASLMQTATDPSGRGIY